MPLATLHITDMWKCGKQLHDRIFSLEREGSVYKTRLTPQRLIEMSVKSIAFSKQLLENIITRNAVYLKVMHGAFYEDIKIQSNLG